MALRYTSVARIYDLEPMIGSLTEITSAILVTAFAEPAEAEMNARLAWLYDVPVSSGVPVLEGMADDLAVYRVLSRRIFTQDQLKDSGWVDRFKEARDMLKAISEGDALLTDATGAVIAQRSDIATARSNVDGYSPTFHEAGSWRDQIKDPDKVDDELDERDLK